MITKRDLEVVDFLNYYKIASTTTIQKALFPSRRVCQRRLKELYDNKKIKRMRNDINAEYIYYVKLPKQWKHSLMVTDFFGDIISKYAVTKFIIEPDMKTMRPDAFFSYQDTKGNHIAFLEVELSHKGFDYAKYERFANEQMYKSFQFPFMPPVFIVGNVNKIIQSDKVKYIKYELGNNNIK